jgi:hypothetical protein
MQKPSLGRIIHFFEEGQKTRAAIVTEEPNPTSDLIVDVKVFNKVGESNYNGVPHKSIAETGQPHWDWPEIKK